MDNIAREHIYINTLRLLYIHYKAFSVPFFVIIIVVGVFIKVSMPAIGDLLKGYEEQKSAKLALENMRNNLKFIKGIDSSNLDSQFRIVSKALPINKEFDGVLYAISDASNKSGVPIGKFKFIIGSLSKEEVGAGEYPVLSISVGLIGNAGMVDKFMKSLVKILPLSDIVKITAQKDTSTVAINFYYKPVKRSKTNDNLSISQISNKGQALINGMSSFSIPQTPNFDSMLNSTPSANPFF